MLAKFALMKYLTAVETPQLKLISQHPKVNNFFFVDSFVTAVVKVSFSIFLDKTWARFPALSQVCSTFLPEKREVEHGLHSKQGLAIEPR